MNEEEMYEKAVEKWGIGLQLGMLMEECAELIQATHKLIRKGDVARNLMAEEIADVEIMIAQIKQALNLQAFVDVKKRIKHHRLEQLLKEDKDA